MTRGHICRIVEFAGVGQASACCLRSESHAWHDCRRLVNIRELVVFLKPTRRCAHPATSL